MHVCAFTGFLLGVKTCDYFFYNEVIKLINNNL
jgi:hypothetical protein